MKSQLANDIQPRNFTLIYPVYNLRILKNIGGELKIERVHFISKEKIPRVRKRLNLKKKVSEMNKIWIKHNMPKLFDIAPSFAVIKIKRSPKDELIEPVNKIKESLWILASSQFSNRRDFIRYFGLPEYQANIITEFFLYDSKEKKSKRSFNRIAPLNPYILDASWRKEMKNHFFSHLLKILNGKIRVKPKWKYDIRNAAILAGKSHFSNDLPQAFLYNMIAIETLLGIPEERFPDLIIDRLNALFGWLSNEDSDFWKPTIKRLYALRCKMVHNGDTRDIKTKDLIASDNILFNLLYNISRFIKKLPNKQSLPILSEKIKARRILGQKIKERDNFRYWHFHMSESTINRIKKKNHWP